MADQTRTFEIRFDTRRAIDALRALERAIDGVDHAADDAGRQVGRIASNRNLRRLRQLSRSADQIGRGVARGFAIGAAAVTGFGLALGRVIDIGADFEQAITSASAKFPGMLKKGEQGYNDIETAAMKAGKTTEFTATQSAKALEFFAMAGFTAEQAISSLPGAIDLATSAGLSLERASDIATDTMGAFGLATKDATQQAINLTRVNDVLAATATGANTTVSEMFEAVKQGGAVAESSGISIETFSAMMSVMANAGIKGGKAGRTFKNAILRLQAPAAAGARQLEKLFGKDGVINKSTGAMRDPIEIIGMLNEKLKDMGTAKQAKILNDIFGKIALPGALTLLEAGNDELERFRQNALKATGLNAKMAETMRNTTRGSINKLTSAIEGLIISFFKLEDSGIRNAIDAMTEWIAVNEEAILQNVGDWLDHIIENWDEILQTIENAAIILGTGGAFYIAIKAVETLVAAFSLGPIGVAFIALTAVVAAEVIKLREQGFTWEETWLHMKITAANAINEILSPLNALIDGFNRLQQITAARTPGELLDALSGKDIGVGFQAANVGIDISPEDKARKKELFMARARATDKADYEAYFERTQAAATQRTVKKYGSTPDAQISDEFQLSTQNLPPVSVQQNVTINTGADVKGVERILKKQNRKAGKQVAHGIMDEYLRSS